MNRIKGCKIELRLTKNKLPIRKLKDLPRLLEFELFSFLKLYRSVFFVRRDGLPFKTIILVLAFQKRVDEVGFSQAKKEFNRSKNFERTIGKHLSKSRINLEKISKRKLKIFFK